MRSLVAPALDNYLSALLPRRDAVLAEMERYAQRHDVPIIGPACGRLLFQLAQLLGAKRIFELGSAIGYSTIWFARAAGAAGEVFYTDGDPANADRARDYFHRAGVQDRIHIRVGDAIDSLAATSGNFDLILIDIDKPQYPAALRKALPRLRSGGLLVTDNVLWSGRVASAAKDPSTRAIRQFNRMIYRSRELFPVIVPLRDGVAVCRKS